MRPGMTVMGLHLSRRYCEKRSDEAIQGVILGPGLLRFARNDGGAGRQSIGTTGLKVVNNFCASALSAPTLP
jgi:hypothetical protein